MNIGYDLKNINLIDIIKDRKIKNDIIKNKVFQTFLRKNNSSSPKDRVYLTDNEKKKIKNFIKENNISAYVHASYMLNFCKFKVGSKRIEWAYNILNEDMVLGEELGFKAIIIHTCTISDNSMIDHLKYFIKNYFKNTKKIKILIENPANDKYIGSKLSDLYNIYNNLDSKRIKICIDTCHAFSAGYPLSSVSGIKSFFEEYKKYFKSLKSIELIHLNDSKHPLGSKKDQHECIGKGYIFKKQENLLFLINIAKKNNINMCLEIPLNCDLNINKKKISIEKVIEIINEYKDYYKVIGNDIKANQYSKAIHSLKQSKIKNISDGNEIFDLKWIGEGMVQKINEYLKNNSIKSLEEIRKNPNVISIKELTSVHGIGNKKAKDLIKKKIYSISDLKKNTDLLTISQQKGLKYYNDLQKKISRKECENIRKIINAELKKINKKYKTILAGSYLNGKEIMGDIDLIISINTIKKGMLRDIISLLYSNNIIIDSLSSKLLPDCNNIKFIGIVKYKNNPMRHIDIHLVKDEELLFHKLYFSSGEYFARQLRQKAKKEGYKLNEKGLFKNNTKVTGFKTEKDIFKFLNIKWIDIKKRYKETILL